MSDLSEDDELLTVLRYQMLAYVQFMEDYAQVGKSMVIPRWFYAHCADHGQQIRAYVEAVKAGQHAAIAWR